jgi:hypothetical protein
MGEKSVVWIIEKPELSIQTIIICKYFQLIAYKNKQIYLKSNDIR